MNVKKRVFCLLLALCLLPLSALAAEETVIPPAYPVPDYVTWLLEIASGEVGYREEAHGRTKYGEWVNDPYTQWCAEFLCWCVDQVDQRHGTTLLKNVYPMYTGTNTGRDWFIRTGRYITRNGHLEGWGYQWLKGEQETISPGHYIPQPGDWVFFTWDSDTDTDHVAMVEYCTQDKDGHVTIHVLEGNNPVAVARNTYSLTYSRILGFGTVHDAADWTMRSGNTGEKVRQLQEKLMRIGFMSEDMVDGRYGTTTAQAVAAYQRFVGENDSGIANMPTQLLLNRDYLEAVHNDPATWTVVDDEDDE